MHVAEHGPSMALMNSLHAPHQRSHNRIEVRAEARQVKYVMSSCLNLSCYLTNESMGEKCHKNSA
jgi:hypothetical protein